ncbi:hypothetical protein D3I60_01970 [Brevibacterium permense]|uniref:hypothetical protein n=1 Tax=Brevibacterium permense TaxID=234834 RepID=UPI0021D239FC|nr:hypothetical protein [Brevibacterium permense]MCU4295858.1 hypothetical protein [Brevibacterium permense]
MNDTGHDAGAVLPGGFQRAYSHLFALSTALFFLGGAAIVLVQIVLLIAAQGAAARDVAEAIGPYAFGMSSVAGLLAFVLTYFRGAGVSADE